MEVVKNEPLVRDNIVLFNCANCVRRRFKTRDGKLREPSWVATEALRMIRPAWGTPIGMVYGCHGSLFVIHALYGASCACASSANKLLPPQTLFFVRVV